MLELYFIQKKDTCFRPYTLALRVSQNQINILSLCRRIRTFVCANMDFLLSLVKALWFNRHEAYINGTDSVVFIVKQTQTQLGLVRNFYVIICVYLYLWQSQL